MSKETNISISDIQHIETPDVSVWYATVHIGGRKRRQAAVKASKKFKQSLEAKISAYCKNRQK